MDTETQYTILSETLEYCEKILMYLATSPSRSEDMLTYSIEFKELIKLEDKVSKLGLPVEK